MLKAIFEKHIVRINQKWVEPSEAAVNILDHGLLFGDSIYEVVRTVNKKPLAWPEHLARLKRSASRIMLTLPWSDADLFDELMAVIQGAKWPDETYVRIVITRGVGEIELLPLTCEYPNLIMIGKAIPNALMEAFRNGIKLCLTDVRRNSRHAMDPGIKSGNYLNNVLAIIEANLKGADDAIMLNENGHLTECTTSNIFLVKDAVVRTPSLECGILEGITRGMLLSILKKEGIQTEETELLIKDLASADEIFITGTIRGVVPVRQVTGMVEWSAEPGPLTKRIKALYDSFIGLTST